MTQQQTNKAIHKNQSAAASTAPTDRLLNRAAATNKKATSEPWNAAADEWTAHRNDTRFFLFPPRINSDWDLGQLRQNLAFATRMDVENAPEKRAGRYRSYCRLRSG